MIFNSLTAVALTPLAALMLTSAGTAPFILTEADAKKIDEMIDLKKCSIDKSRHSRYYWYDATSDGDRYIINLYEVNFVVISNNHSNVRALADTPLKDGHDYRLKAYGTFNITKRTHNVTCVRAGS